MFSKIKKGLVHGFAAVVGPLMAEIGKARRDDARLDQALGFIGDLEISDTIDLSVAENVAETVIWAERNEDLLRRRVVSENAIPISGCAAAFLNIKENLYDGGYDGAAENLFRLANKRDGFSPDDVKEFVDYAKKCRSICLENGVAFEAVSSGYGLPGYFEEQIDEDMRLRKEQVSSLYLAFKESLAHLRFVPDDKGEEDDIASRYGHSDFDDSFRVWDSAASAAMYEKSVKAMNVCTMITAYGELTVYAGQGVDKMQIAAMMFDDMKNMFDLPEEDRAEFDDFVANCIKLDAEFTADCHDVLKLH